MRLKINFMDDFSVFVSQTLNNNRKFHKRIYFKYKYDSLLPTEQLKRLKAYFELYGPTAEY